MYKRVPNFLKDTWSTTGFSAEEVSFYAQKLTIDEARKGLMGLSLILLGLFCVEGLLFSHSGLGASAVTTCMLLAVLSLHILLSARATHDVRSLYLLGTTLLMISGTAFVLLAHNAGSFSFALFASVTLLFMVVPLVPWGLKEALLVLALIYGTFTFSTWSTSQNFDSQTLWSLQFIMLGAGTISLALVARNTMVRKADILNRFELEQVNKKMMHLSNKDPLTGAWNRRFLNNAYHEETMAWHDAGQTFHFAFLDLDNFKPVNDNCGHDFGDEVLRCVSHAFVDTLQDDGYLIRMGGDEFALLFTGDDPERLIAETFETVQTAIKPPGKYKKMTIGISVGLVSILPGVKVSQDEIYRLVDTALYRAKERKELFSGRVNIIKRVVKSGKKRQKSVA